MRKELALRALPVRALARLPDLPLRALRLPVVVVGWPSLRS